MTSAPPSLSRAAETEPGQREEQLHSSPVASKPRVTIEMGETIITLEQTSPACLRQQAGKTMMQLEPILDLNEMELCNVLDSINETMDPREALLPQRQDRAQQTRNDTTRESHAAGESTVSSSKSTTTTPSPTSGNRPTKHNSTERKIKLWNLLITHKHLIIGDCNVARFTTYTFLDLQIDSFAGATFRHIHGVLEKLQPNLAVETVILSLGIHNRK